MFVKMCRVGRDPELRQTTSGTAVVGLSLAYQYGLKGEDGKRPTQWLDAAVFGKQADAIAQYVHKGDLISVAVDDLHIEEYEGKNGKGFKLAGKVVSFDFVPTGEKKEPKHEPKPEPKKEYGKTGMDNFDDDLIPF